MTDTPYDGTSTLPMFTSTDLARVAWTRTRLDRVAPATAQLLHHVYVHSNDIAAALSPNWIEIAQ